jgi:hypothetical protein
MHHLCTQCITYGRIDELMQFDKEGVSVSLLLQCKFFIFLAKHNCAMTIGFKVNANVEMLHCGMMQMLDTCLGN